MDNFFLENNHLIDNAKFFYFYERYVNPSFFYKNKSRIKFIRNIQMNSNSDGLKVNSLFVKTDKRFFNLLKIKWFTSFKI